MPLHVSVLFKNKHRLGTVHAAIGERMEASMRYSWDMGQELWLLGGTNIGTLQGVGAI